MYRVVSELGKEEFERKKGELEEQGYEAHSEISIVPCFKWMKDALYIQAFCKEIPTLDDQIIE